MRKRIDIFSTILDHPFLCPLKIFSLFLFPFPFFIGLTILMFWSVRWKNTMMLSVTPLKMKEAKKKMDEKVYELELRRRLIPLLPKCFREELSHDEYMEEMRLLIARYEQTICRDRPPLIEYYCQSVESQCSICLGAISAMDNISSFTCEHKLHSHCMVEFLQSRSQVRKCCPLCREETICYSRL